MPGVYYQSSRYIGTREKLIAASVVGLQIREDSQQLYDFLEPDSFIRTSR